MARINDLRGQTFGERFVYGAAPSKHGKARWKVRCSCGETNEVFGRALLAGKANSCIPCALKKRREKEVAKLSLLDLPRKVVGYTPGKTRKNGFLIKVQCRCGYVSEVKPPDVRKSTYSHCLSCSAQERERIKLNGKEPRQRRRKNRTQMPAVREQMQSVP